MLENWNDITITQIKLAIYVEPGTGSAYHTNRPSHGFVIDDVGGKKEYCFSDGTVLHTKGRSVFYLPKGSSYQVKGLPEAGGCWAINFLLAEDVSEKPFVLDFKNTDSILEDFKDAVAAFKRADSDANLCIKRNLYDIILRIRRESARIYNASAKLQMIQPAIDEINTHFADNSLSVRELAVCCQMSENYFRRIFCEEFGVSPKEYIIRRRLEYAKALLQGEQFSVSEVAELCGYFEPCHFTREFTKRTGKSPSQYGKTPR